MESVRRRFGTGGRSLPHSGERFGSNTDQHKVEFVRVAPSIRPLQVQGPQRWMGRPGAPEPGLLSTLVHLVIALLLWLWMRRSRTGSRRTSAA